MAGPCQSLSQPWCQSVVKGPDFSQCFTDIPVIKQMGCCYLTDLNVTKRPVLGPPLKKSLFPVERVATPYQWPVGRLQNLFFFFSFFFVLIEMVGKMLGGKRKNREMWKKCAHPVLISSPRRWTGNQIIFKGGLVVTASLDRSHWSIYFKDVIWDWPSRRWLLVVL